MEADNAHRMLFELDYWKQLNSDIGTISNHSDEINSIVQEMIVAVAVHLGKLEVEQGDKLMGFVERIQNELEPQLKRIVEMSELVEGRLKALKEEFDCS